MFRQRTQIEYCCILKNIAVQIVLNKFSFFWLTNRLTNILTNKHIVLRTYRLTNTSTCGHIDQKHIDLPTHQLANVIANINLRTYRIMNTSTCEHINLGEYRFANISNCKKKIDQHIYRLANIQSCGHIDLWKYRQTNITTWEKID